MCRPNEDGSHGRYADSIATACSLPCNLVQAQHSSPRVSVHLPITRGVVVCGNTTPVPQGWYDML